MPMDLGSGPIYKWNGREIIKMVGILTYKIFA